MKSSKQTEKVNVIGIVQNQVHLEVKVVGECSRAHYKKILLPELASSLLQKTLILLKKAQEVHLCQIHLIVLKEEMKIHTL
jgi:hypothetical protein